MKVIMKNQSTLMVEMTPTELHNIIGFEGSCNMDDITKKLYSFGDEIPVAEIFSQARKTAKNWNEDYNFQEAIKHIESLKKELTGIMNSYVKPPKKLIA